MSRRIVRVIAILFLIGSSVAGIFATYVYLSPSDEQRLYEQKHQEAIQKIQKAEAAKGTSAEPRLAAEAKEAVQSAEAWGQGYRDRVSANRLGVILSGVVAFLSLIVLLLTFNRGKTSDQALSGSQASFTRAIR
jgi:hypothetical protein